MLKTITSTANTVGSLEYKGLWNAATNTPTLVSSVGTQGDYYVVSVAGTTNLDGVTTWDEGDWAIFNGSVWQLFQDGQDGVFATLTVSNYAAFADNAKATFGTGAGDLQIYHDGSYSWIKDAGTGSLIVAATNLSLQNAATTKAYANFNDGGSSTIHYDGSPRLATTATGIDITGTATMDGLTVEGSGTSGIVAYISNEANEVGEESLIWVGGQTKSNYGVMFGATPEVSTPNVQDHSFIVKTNPTTGLSHLTRLKVSSDGDISFYEDTGTTPKFVWDASAESLGIGTSSPANPLHVATASTDVAKFATTGAYNFISLDNATRNWALSAGSAFGIYDATAASTRMSIDSSGNVGINDSNPSNKLTVNSTSGAGIKVYGADQAYSRIAIDNLNGQEWNLVAGVAGASNTGFGIYDVDAGAIRLQIDASGNVGIGTDSPGSKVTISDPGTGIGLINAASGNFNIGLLAGTGSPNAYIFQRANAPLLFGTNNVERARLTGDGDFLVGKTSTAFGTEGFVYEAGAAVEVTTDSNRVMRLNRTTSDGNIIELNKDGTSVGSIGSHAGIYTYIGTDDTALLFAGNIDAVIPFSPSASNYRDNAIDLGTSNYRFKDLYLSGGVVFGTTGGSVSSKTLDDYEEGTFTPTLFGSGSSATTLLTALGRYVKVGKSVTCWVEISCDGSTTLPTGNYISLAGLPFSPVSSRTFISVVRVTGLTGLASGTYFVGFTSSGTTVNLEKMNQDGIIGAVGLTAASLTSTFGAAASITYEAA